MPAFLQALQDDFFLNFIKEDRWRWIFSGLLVTLKITFFALLIGLAIGFVVAIVRTTRDKNGGGPMLAFFDALCRFYLAVVRGTPVVVQLLIIYYVVFSSVNVDKALAAIIAFGINSGAYVAEIVRSGIMSIDAGQFEAGRSLGFGYVQTMRYIILPQAVKNVLPALGNEFIVLIKETSICGYIGLDDVTRGGYLIMSRTYSPFMPLISVALIYLCIVMLFTFLVGRLERRLRNSDH